MDRANRTEAIDLARLPGGAPGGLTPATVGAGEHGGVPPRARSVGPGTRVLAANRQVDHVVYVRSGELGLEFARPGGGRLLLTLLRHGDSVGDVSVLTGEPLLYDVVARRHGTVVEIPAPTYLAWLQRTPGVAVRWLSSALCRQEHLRRRVLVLTTKGLDEQVAWTILHHQDAAGNGSPRVELSHRDIAELLGARRPSVTGAVRKLRKRGLIRTGYSCIEVIDPQGLAECAGPPAAAGPCPDPALPS